MLIKHNNAKAQPAKASFDHTYDCPDPELYFRELRPLDYRIPQSALPLVEACVSSLQHLRQRRQLSILDLCCSYGVNAALINHQLTLHDLYAYYTDDKRTALPLVQRLAADQDFFARSQTASPHRVIGIDVARNALAYARLAGLMPQSFAANLESQSQSIDDALVRALVDVDLIIVTGGLSYIGARTFRRLLEQMPPQRRPWIMCFALRISELQQPIAEFSRFGLRTETPSQRTFAQRKFVDSAERDRVMRQLQTMSLDPTGKEAEGYLHATLYLSRPSADVMRVPFQQLVN